MLKRDKKELKYGQGTVRKYFLLPSDLFKRAELVAKESGLNFSEVLRKALEEYVDKKLKEKTDKQIAEACVYYYDIDKKIAEEWRNTEGGI